MRAEPIFYNDGKEWRIVDLRPDGCDCLPLLAKSNFNSVRSGVDMHIHPGCIEICLCLKGNVRYETNDGEYQLLPGHFFVSQPDQTHRRCNNPKGMNLYRILFAIPKRGGTMLGLSPAETRFVARSLEQYPYRICPSSDRIRHAFERLFTVYDTERRGTLVRKLKMKSAALELLLALAEAPNLPSSANRVPNAKVKAIIDRMKEYPSEDYPVEALAHEAALSSVALNEAFKRATGLTPHAYLLDVRVRRARKDLVQGNSIAAVAARYRFPSPTHFATIFKRVLGISPRNCVNSRN